MREDKTSNPLAANTLTPLDGRNYQKVLPLAEIFSELSLDKKRILVEISYLIKLSDNKIIRKLTPVEKKYLLNISNEFSERNYQRIREIEKITNHDLKAVEEFIKEKLRTSSLSDVAEMVHFGLTADDTNNISYALILSEGLKYVIAPEIEKILFNLKAKAEDYKNIPLLGRTHGQPAIPTTIGKEIAVFYQRLNEEFQLLKSLKLKAKLTGNVGNLNVHKLIYPKVDWPKFSRNFIESFGIKADLLTTQIEPYDSYLSFFQSLANINNILLGLCLDFWLYISAGLYLQKNLKQEVGSTALPHKINPIYFEGAEGGFGIANALFDFYCRKLSSSRLQRDLSDSTVRRSFGIAFGYSLLSYQSINEALTRITPNISKLNEELNNHWEVLSEAVQNYLRTKGQKDAYDKTKSYFRGNVITKETYQKFVNSLNLPPIDKKILLNLTPEKYIGYAPELVSLIK